MSNKEEDFSRIFIWVLAFLVLFTIVVMLLARAVGMNENSGPMTESDIDARTIPYGTVKVAGVEAAAAPAVSAPAPVAAAPAAPEPVAAPVEAAPAAAVTAIDGQSLYAACAACHSTGAAGAPKLGDAAAWGPRAAAGIDALLTNAINGKGAMPPKGGRMDLNDAQIKAIIEYMVNAAK